jgi:myosin-1
VADDDTQVLLAKVNDAQIVTNLERRFSSDLIYTFIGPVLIAVNPYKSLSYFTEKELELYHGAVCLIRRRIRSAHGQASHENPPHIYAVAESMFQNMMIDGSTDCFNGSFAPRGKPMRNHQR